jgi:hypothetical protein
MFDIANTSFTTAQSPETFHIISDTIADPITGIKPTAWTGGKYLTHYIYMTSIY